MSNFENLLMLLAGRPPESCGLSGRCANQLVVEADGGVYPCDFYVLDCWKLGNLVVDPIEELLRPAKAQEFIRESMKVHPRCEACRWRKLCGGGCRRERVPAEGGELYYYCEPMQEFLEFAVPKMQRLLQAFCQ